VGIKLESLHPIRGPKQIQSAAPSKFFFFNNGAAHIQSFTYFKKKKKLLLTLISGPHVHKKSREQYKIDHYEACAFFKAAVDCAPLSADDEQNSFS
jgi:hypothetical protein